MTKIAVDIVLLPSDEMTDLVITFNRNLKNRIENKIDLNKENCFPHISLTMGCIETDMIPTVKDILLDITQNIAIGKLTANSVTVNDSPNGEKVSTLDIVKTPELQYLHETITQRLKPHLTCDVTADMLICPPVPDEPTLTWIRQFRQSSSFQNFWPHITIGFGQATDIELPINFTTTKLAMFHLANCCTCRKKLISINLKHHT